MRCAALAICFAFPLLAQEKVDLGVVKQIKVEAFDHSKVMETLSYLSDWYGPRLTGSPEFRQAADWAVQRLSEYGLDNPHLEKWGQFGRSWTLEQYAVEMLEPRYSLLAASPLAWSAPTNGPVTGAPILASVSSAQFWDLKTYIADVDKFIEKNKGTLRGKIVMVSKPMRDVTAPEKNPAVRRYTDADLAGLAAAPEIVPKPKIDPKNLNIPEDPDEARAYLGALPFAQIMEIFEGRQAARDKLNRFFIDEGVAAVFSADERAREGMTFAEAAGNYKPGGQLAPATFVITAEHYNRIARLINEKAPVRLRVNLKAHVPDAPADAYNIVGEIPGTSKRGEVVMLGAHFDSWHSGTGATDNGAGSAVMIEAVRILKALDLKMERTVRIALWSGEEQGLLGSRAYIKEHFGDPATMRLTADHANLAGYFNVDNGSGKIRGVYLQDNDAMRPIFEQWLAPFRDLGVTTVSIRNTGGTDHLSFDAVGLPGFQFIQDPLDYGTVTHHSVMDTYDHAQPGDLMEASAVVAACVYEAATRPDKLPRKPLPKAQ